MLNSSKLADVLRKLHNANDMSHSSVYETTKPSSPSMEETSVALSSTTDHLPLNDDSQQECIERRLDVHNECQKTIVEEPDAHESSMAKVTSD